MNKKIKVADIILIISFIVISFIPLLFKGETASFATVRVDGEIIMRISLDKDGEYEIKGIGVAVVEDGCIYVKDMNCPDKVCERMGKICDSSRSVVCMPNRLVISIDKDSEVDGSVG